MQAVLREWREAERRLCQALGTEREADFRTQAEAARREYQRLMAAETSEEFDHSDAPRVASLE